MGDMKFLPPSNYPMQGHLDNISTWTDRHMMKLNEAKCNYLIFSRTKQNFSTRLSVNNVLMDRLSVTKILGVWISEDLSWDKNCQEICKKAYARLGMITKLKYVGVNREDLINI